MEKSILSFVESIKIYLEEHDLSVSAFARKLSVKDVCVARWLKGENIPSTEYVILVADYMNCSVDYLLGVKDEVHFDRAEEKSVFIDRFVLLLKSTKISMNQLAKGCNVTSSNVSKWILRKQMPKPYTIVAIAEWFNCSVDYLLGRTNIK